MLDSIAPARPSLRPSFHPSIYPSVRPGPRASVRPISLPPPNRELPAEVAARFVPVIRQAALRVARRLPAHICVDDLVSAGFMGLVDAYRRYDASRCDRFDAYAEVRIKGAILDELRSYDPLSRDLRALANRAGQATRELASRLGRVPSDVEVAAELGMDLEGYRAAATRIALGSPVSLDAAPQGDEPPFELGDPTSTPADELLLQAQSRAALRGALERLPPRLRGVLDLYYREERTLREIGAMLGVTESRVCQLHGEAIRKLRALCTTEAENETEEAAPATRRTARAKLAA
jgi:RNA polymerase sigma factor for flagellar operon FliA